MLSSKLLPEMEIEDNTKREQLLGGISNLPVTVQIEKLKVIFWLVPSFIFNVDMFFLCFYPLFFVITIHNFIG